MFTDIDDTNIVKVLSSLGIDIDEVKAIHDEVYDWGYVLDERLNIQNQFQNLLDKNNINYIMVVEVKNRSGLNPWDEMADDDDDYFVYNLVKK